MPFDSQGFLQCRDCKKCAAQSGCKRRRLKPIPLVIAHTQPFGRRLAFCSMSNDKGARLRSTSQRCSPTLGPTAVRCYMRWSISIATSAESPLATIARAGGARSCAARAGDRQENLGRRIDHKAARWSRRSHQCAEPDGESVADAASDCALAARGA